MSEDYLAPQPIAVWNSARGVWEIQGMVSLLCEHWALFSETWPTSGTMRDGQVFALPMLAHHTLDIESLLSPIPDESMLRTPSAIEGEGGAITEDQARARNRMVQVRDQMAQLAAENGLKVSPGIKNGLLPTVTTQDGKNNGGPSQADRNTPPLNSLVATFKAVTMNDLLPTPNTMEHREIKTPEQIAELKQRSPGGYRNLREEVIHEATSWGKFEPAIRRWESVIGRDAPAPTKPDGKNGAHRLSSAFTEWMMGLPEGWVTDCGLSRNEELKACGNGVVPQQAEMALRILLSDSPYGLPIKYGDGNWLPTPTVADMFTGALKSSQQSDGSMHSVSLPQAIGQLSNEQ